MQVSEDGQTIVVGSAACADATPYGAAKVLIGLVALSCLVAPPLLALAIEHEATEIPDSLLSATLPGIVAVLIGAAALVAIRFAVTLLEDGLVVAARFDREHALVELTSKRMFGLSRAVLPFSSVKALRMSRGKLDDDCTKQMPVMVLMDNSMIALPEALQSRELQLLKLLTGMRRV